MSATWVSYRVRWNVVLLLVGLSVLAETSQRSQPVSELQPLEAGITLPVQIGRTLRAGKVKPGTVFEATTTQRVPVSADAYLKRGAKVRGEVVRSEGGDKAAGRPSILSIRFTELSYGGKTVPVETRAIAAASFMRVDDTFLPTTGGPDRGNASEASWTTPQVGGDQVNRSGWVGVVSNRTMQVVGSADYHGVYSLPVEVGGGAMVPRAMGVFSTTAKGLYGYDEKAKMESSGGVITISNPTKGVEIQNRDQMLLEVIASH